MGPFRRHRYRTSHCYSELSGDYWDKLSHSTITHIFAGIHAQARASKRELGSRSYIVYLELYIANLYRPAFVSACVYLFIVKYQLVLFINHVRQILSNMVSNKLSMIAAVLY